MAIPFRIDPAVASRSNARRRTARQAVLSAGLLLITSGALGGCSSVPDAVNPVSWYRDVADLMSGTPESEAAAAAEQREVSGGFPNVNDVPTRPKILSPAERKNIADGLIADRANAKYTQESISREGTPTRPMAPRSAEPSAAGLAAPVQGTSMSLSVANPQAAAAAPRAAAESPVTAAPPAPVAQAPLPPIAPPTAEAPEPNAAARLHFADRGAALTSADIEALRDVARQQISGGGTVRVIGYAGGVSTRADEAGRMVEELDLAIRRTDAVVRELVRLGVPPARISATTAESAPASGLTEIFLE